MHVDYELFFAVDRYRAGRMGFERMRVSVETRFVRVICQIAADELDVRIVVQTSLPLFTVFGDQATRASTGPARPALHIEGLLFAERIDLFL